MGELVTPVPVRVVMGQSFHDYICDDCEVPVKDTGHVYTTDPAMYKHVCPQCNRNYTLRKQYPFMVFRYGS